MLQAHCEQRCVNVLRVGQLLFQHCPGMDWMPKVPHPAIVPGINLEFVRRTKIQTHHSDIVSFHVGKFVSERIVDLEELDGLCPLKVGHFALPQIVRKVHLIGAEPQHNCLDCGAHVSLAHVVSSEAQSFFNCRQEH